MELYKAVIKQNNEYISIACVLLNSINKTDMKFVYNLGNIKNIKQNVDFCKDIKSGLYFFHNIEDVKKWIFYLNNDDLYCKFMKDLNIEKYYLIKADIDEKNIIEKNTKEAYNLKYVMVSEATIKDISVLEGV